MAHAADESGGRIARLAQRFGDWSQRWIPDAFVFALLATAIAALLGLTVARATPADVVLSWGKGFWSLATFTLQMAMIVIIGHLLATAPPIARLIEWLAGKPTTARQATTLVAVFAMATSWVNWGFSLIVSAALATRVARHRPDADYRALAASSLLGLGSVWAQGLSGSAALQMASPAMLQNAAVRDAVSHGGLVPGGIIPLTRTVFLWQSVVSVLVEIAVVATVVWLYTPPPSRSPATAGANLASRAAAGANLASPAAAGANLGSAPLRPEREIMTEQAPRSPGERLEHSPALNLVVVALGASYLAVDLGSAGDKLAAIDVGHINLAFLLLGMLMHRTPARVMRAVREGTPAVWGVLLQFPFYGGISGLITGTKLSSQLAAVFLRLSTPFTFPPLVAAYSALLGVFVPSGGSKWVIEAPYVMEAAHAHHVHLGWMVAVYDLGEALANLVQPFWMLPTLALMGLRARDVMGFTLLVFLALAPVVLVLTALLGRTLAYPL